MGGNEVSRKKRLDEPGYEKTDQDERSSIEKYTPRRL
jgi:hypothetical protein